MPAADSVPTLTLNTLGPHDADHFFLKDSVGLLSISVVFLCMYVSRSFEIGGVTAFVSRVLRSPSDRYAMYCLLFRVLRPPSGGGASGIGRLIW